MAMEQTTVIVLREPKLKPINQIVEINPATLDSFEYRESLSTTSIRLLHFHEDEYQLPDSGGRQKICTMETFSLDDAPPFLALSYAWKAPRIDKDTIIAYKEPREWFIRQGDQHYRTNIGRNLYEGLQRITNEFTSTPYIWIDALCINQDDLDERAFQVSIMGDIYSACVQVVVWLGAMDPSEAEDIYMLHCQVLPEIVEYVKSKNFEPGNWTGHDLREWFNLGKRAITGRHWETYIRLFNQTTWFHRVWVVQELAMAPHAIVLWGDWSLPWEGLVLLSVFLAKCGLRSTLVVPQEHGGFSGPVVPAGAVLTSMNMLLNLARFLKGLDARLMPVPPCVLIAVPPRGAWLGFMECIQSMRALESTDPRDHVYAALGFLQLDKSTAGIMVPDYRDENTPEKVFMSATLAILKAIPGLDILASREDCERKLQWKNLPSWVPDFTVAKAHSLAWEQQTPPQPSRHSNRTQNDPTIMDQRLGVGTKNPTLATPNWRQEGTKLILQGRKIDVVRQLHSWKGLETMCCEASLFMAWLKIWFDAVKHLLIQSPYDEDPLEVLWRTVIANRTDFVEPRIDSSYFRSWIALASLNYVRCRADSSNSETVIHPAVISDMFPDSESKPSRVWLESLQASMTRVRSSAHREDGDVEVFDVHKKFVAFLGRVSKFLANRQLYVTSTGLVGLGPQSAKEGDEVVCVKDSKILFVVRPGDGDYQLVGDTYLHGRMEMAAEIANSERAESTPPWVDIVLC